MQIRIGASAVSDHLSRLYERGEDGRYRHIDNGGTITVINETKNQATIELDKVALSEFINDMDYQVEFTEGQYRTQCKRALRTLKSAS
jgi:hypothetical protein